MEDHRRDDGDREKWLVVEALEEREGVDRHVEPLGDAHRDEDLRAVGDEALDDA